MTQKGPTPHDYSWGMVRLLLLYILPTQLRFRSKLFFSRSDFSFRSIHPKRWNSRPTGSHDDESISRGNKLWGLQLDAAAGTDSFKL